MKKLYRNQTKEIRIGDVVIGGNHPVAIQSMTNTRTEDVKGTVEQIHRLEKAGCEIIRCTVPTREAAEALKEIKKQIHIPLVADIHFDYRLAIAAIENGADKIRINPGNIGTKERVQAVVDKAKEYGHFFTFRHCIRILFQSVFSLFKQYLLCRTSHLLFRIS